MIGYIPEHYRRKMGSLTSMFGLGLFQRKVDEAVLVERELCAKLAESMPGGEAIATAIRQRSQQEIR